MLFKDKKNPEVETTGGKLNFSCYATRIYKKTSQVETREVEMYRETINGVKIDL